MSQSNTIPDGANSSVANQAIAYHIVVVAYDIAISRNDPQVQNSDSVVKFLTNKYIEVLLALEARKKLE